VSAACLGGGVRGLLICFDGLIGIAWEMATFEDRGLIWAVADVRFCVNISRWGTRGGKRAMLGCSF